MGIVDIVVFVGFVALVMAVGLWKSKSAHSEEGGAADYFLAGRGLKWWLIGVSLIAANISAEQFVGMSGAAAQDIGIAVASYEWMAAVTLVIVGFTFLPYFLKTGIYTIPGFLEHRYNKAAKSIMAVFMMVLLVGVSLCGVIYAGALPMRELLAAAGFSIPLAACCWIMGGLAAAYVATGGLKACAWADLIQGVALLIGGALIAYFAFQALGLAAPEELVQGIGAVESGTQQDATAVVGEWARFKALNADKLHMFLPDWHSYLPWTALLIGLWIPNLYYWGLNQYITQRTLGSSSLAEGQKGIVFAAALKLLIPFIVVFPGLIAFNLFSTDMADRAASDHIAALEDRAKIKASPAGYSAEQMAALNALNKEVADGMIKDELRKRAPRPALFSPTDRWINARPPEQVNLLNDYNALVMEAGFDGDANEQAKAVCAYKTDAALGLLVSKLCMGKTGLFGFIAAALLGAIVSSLAAVLNAASTIFAMDIYRDYLNRKATQKQLVGVGRISVGVFVVIGCVVAPLLDRPSFGGVFKYIQEFQGFVSPGVLAVFVFGLLNRTATGATGVTGLLLSPVIFGFLKWGPEKLGGIVLPSDMNNRMAISLVVILMVMTVMGLVKRLPKPVEFASGTKIDLRPSKGARIGGLCVVLVTAVLYVIFR